MLHCDPNPRHVRSRASRIEEPRSLKTARKSNKTAARNVSLLRLFIRVTSLYVRVNSPNLVVVEVDRGVAGRSENDVREGVRNLVDRLVTPSSTVERMSVAMVAPHEADRNVGHVYRLSESQRCDVRPVVEGTSDLERHTYAAIRQQRLIEVIMLLPVHFYCP